VALYGAETWRQRKLDRYSERLKCGAGEGWKRIVGPIL
jgi:hypothetical protein